MSGTLAAMAILKANWDEKRDYLSNFQPFVDDVLRGETEHEPVEAAAVAKAVKESWGIEIPQATVGTMLRRAEKRGLLFSEGRPRRLYPAAEALDKLVDLRAASQAAERSTNALIDRLVEYAASQDIHWTHEEAEQALLLYLDEYGTSFATRRGQGGLPSSVSGGRAVAIVHSLARHADERDPDVLDWLEQAVQGAMFSNVLRFADLGHTPGRVSKLVVYLDTSIVVRALDISVPQLAEAARELLELLKRLGAPVRVFEHTLVEVEGVLRAVAGNLSAPRRRAMQDTAHMTWQRREVLDYFLSTGRTSGDVEEVIANLEKRLLQLGIQVEATPPHTERLTLDEAKLQEFLRERVGYRTDAAAKSSNGDAASRRIPALERDVDSLTAIHRLRKGRVFRDLGKCPAVFLTNNRPLAAASRRYFREENLEAGVPHCYWEPELVTQLWVRTPSEAAALPRKTMLADSYAALQPSARLWERYVTKIEQMQAAGSLTDDDVTSLIYSTTARSVLTDITQGSDDAFEDEATIGEVLARTTREAQAAERERAAELQKALEQTEEKAASRESVLQGTVAQLETETARLAQELADLTAARRKNIRRLVCGAAIALGTSAAIVPWVLEMGTIATTAIVTVGLALVLVFSLRLFMSWKAVKENSSWIAALIGLSGVVALFVSAASDGASSRPARPAPALTTTTSAKPTSTEKLGQTGRR